MLCANMRDRYQVSVYRIIGPLVKFYSNDFLLKCFFNVTV